MTNLLPLLQTGIWELALLLHQRPVPFVSILYILATYRMRIADVLTSLVSFCGLTMLRFLCV